MYPWSTPPTSWPTAPQHPPASSTWPQSTPSAHLFGQPSPLHPTWSSSSSLLPPASTTTSLSFASLATAPHALPAPHLVPTMTTPLAPETTIVHTAHRLSLLPRHPLFQLHGTLLQLHPTHRLPHLHRCRAHRTHLVPFIPHR